MLQLLLSPLETLAPCSTTACEEEDKDVRYTVAVKGQQEGLSLVDSVLHQIHIVDKVRLRALIPTINAIDTLDDGHVKVEVSVKDGHDVESHVDNIDIAT